MKALLCSKKGQVERLYPFVLLVVLVGMVIGVGVLTIDKIGSATYYTRTGYNESLASTDITNTTHHALNHGNITSFTKAVNQTGGITLNSRCYSVNTTEGFFQYINITLSDGTSVGDDACSIVEGMEVIYSYKEYATETRDATMNSRIELAKISSDWLGLIVTVFVLAIILILVIMNFAPMAGGRG